MSPVSPVSGERGGGVPSIPGDGGGGVVKGRAESGRSTFLSMEGKDVGSIHFVLQQASRCSTHLPPSHSLLGYVSLKEGRDTGSDEWTDSHLQAKGEQAV